MFVSIEDFNSGRQYRGLFASGCSFKTKKVNPYLIMHNGLYKIAKVVINPLDKEHISGYDIPTKSFYSANEAIEEYLYQINDVNGGIDHDGVADFLNKDDVVYKLCEHLVYEC